MMIYKCRYIDSLFFFKLFTVVLLGMTLPSEILAKNSLIINSKMPSYSVSGSLFKFNITTSVSYIFRAVDDGSEKSYDNDLYQDLQLQITAPQNRMFEFNFFGTLREDVDGDINSTGFFPLEDIGDTRTTQISGTIYEAHFDFNYLLPFLKQIRLGRQTGERDKPVFFDGLTIDLIPFEQLFLTVYGGISSQFFEIDYSWGSDFLVGAGMDFSPLSSMCFSLDYMFVKNELNDVPGKTANDHLLSLKYRQKLFSFLRFMLKLRFFDFSVQDLSANITATIQEIDMEVSTRHILLFNTSEGFSNELSSFNDFLNPVKPYYSFDGRVRKLFGDKLAVDMGLFMRFLFNQKDSNSFNNNSTKIYSVLELQDIFIPGSFFSFTGDIWLGADSDYYSGGLNIAYTFQRVIKGTTISLGAALGSYNYQYYKIPEESELVKSFNTEVVIPFKNCMSFSCKYELEDASETYNTVKIRV